MAVLADKRTFRRLCSFTLYPCVHFPFSENFAFLFPRCCCDGFANAGRKLWTEPDMSSSVKMAETLNATNRGEPVIEQPVVVVLRERFLRW